VFNYNAWYGRATNELVDTTISELESGNQERVLAALKSLEAVYEPTYEHRADYEILVERAVSEMKGE